MKHESFIGDKKEYVQKLANEITDLKDVLQDISQQVRRIERRVGLVLPKKTPEKRQKRKVIDKSRNRSVKKVSTMSEMEAQQTITRLVENLSNGKSIESVQSELRSLTMKYGLTPIARVLGMTNTALPPKTELIMNIITRLRQSVMLTENIRKG